MKKITTIILLLSLFICNSQDIKSINCLYKIIVQPISPEKLNAISNVAVRSRILAKQNENSTRQFILKGNLNNALFEELPRMNSDFSKKMQESESKYYHDEKLKMVFNSYFIFNQYYSISYNDNYYNWQISTESKVIDGYKCFKANGTSEINDFRGKKKYFYEAWFCPEIPFHYGPWFYFGLPGLIFEASEKTAIDKYVLTSIKFSKEDIKIEKPKGKPVTNKEFDKIFNDYFVKMGSQ